MTIGTPVPTRFQVVSVQTLGGGREILETDLDSDEAWNQLRDWTATLRGAVGIVVIIEPMPERPVIETVDPGEQPAEAVAERDSIEDAEAFAYKVLRDKVFARKFGMFVRYMDSINERAE